MGHGRAPRRGARRAAYRRDAGPPADPLPDAVTVLTVRRTLIAAGIALVALLMLAAPAGAHAVLEQTNPAAGQAYSTAPTTITLTFDEHVQVGLGGIRLFDSKSHRIDIGPPTQVGDSKTVTVTVPKLADGTYVATWRVISADGHPVDGAFTFSVGEPSKLPASAEALANQLLDTQKGSRVVGVINGALRFVEFSAVGLLVGGFAFVALCWPAGRRSRATRAAAEGLVDRCLRRLDRGRAHRVELHGGPGLLGVVQTDDRAPVHRHARRARDGDPRRRPARRRGLVGLPLLRRASLGLGDAVIGSALALMSLATFTLAGHAQRDPGSRRDPRRPRASRGVLAVVRRPRRARRRGAAARRSVGARARGLAVLERRARRSRRAHRHRRLSGLAPGRVVRRAQGHDLRPAAAREGRARRVVVLVAALSRDTVRQHLDREPEPLESEEARVPLPVGPGAALADPDSNTARTWCTGCASVSALEVVFLVLVLATTALLVNAPPARSVVNAPYSTTLQGKGISFEVLLVPARSGPNEVHLTALEPNGTLFPLVGSRRRAQRSGEGHRADQGDADQARPRSLHVERAHDPVQREVAARDQGAHDPDRRGRRHRRTGPFLTAR